MLSTLTKSTNIGPFHIETSLVCYSLACYVMIARPKG